MCVYVCVSVECGEDGESGEGIEREECGEGGKWSVERGLIIE